jgi:REP element-mobilizing transposase RayT
MANTYVQQRIHIVWSTKHRAPVLEASHWDHLPRVIGGIIKRDRGQLFACGGMADHIHVYAEYPKTISLSEFVNSLKTNSSKWIREQPGMEHFHWQGGYGAFTVGRKGDESLMAYIRNQATHHRTVSFQDEYLKLLRRCGVPYDLKYVFD